MAARSVPPGALTTKAVLYNGVWRSPVGPKPRPLWVLREHDGAEECFKVMWSDRSHMMVDEDEVKDCDLVARVAAAQDVDDVDGQHDLEPLNQGLRLLEHTSARLVKVKEERDDEREEKEDAQELSEQLCRSENNKMSEIDALKKEAAQKDRRVAELEESNRKKETLIETQRRRIQELESEAKAQNTAHRKLEKEQRRRIQELESKAEAQNTAHRTLETEKAQAPKQKRSRKQEKRTRKRQKRPGPCKRCGKDTTETWDPSVSCFKCRICRKGGCSKNDGDDDFRVTCQNCYGTAHTECLDHPSCGICGFTVCIDCEVLIEYGCGDPDADCHLPRCRNCIDSGDKCEHVGEFEPDY